MSTHGQSLGALGSLVSSLGLQFDSITAEQVSKGALAREGVKLLLLPYAQILRKGEADAIRAFVKQGGTVVADARVGLFDEHGAPYAKPILDDVLGVTTGPVAKPELCDLKVKGEGQGQGEGALLAGAMVDTSVKATTAKPLAQCEKGAAFFVNDFGKGHAVLINFNLAVIPFLDGRNELGGVRDTLVEIMALAGLKAPARMVGADGKVITGTEFTRYVRGSEIYLGVEKTGHAYEKFPMKAFVELDKKYWVYDVRAGKKVGFTDRIPMDLEGLDVGLYSLLPAEAKQLTLDIPSTVRPGTALKATATLSRSASSPSPSPSTFTSTFRWELIPDGGYSMEEFMPYPWRVRDAKDGKGATEWAIGYGEKPGTKFTAVVTDVETGLTASRVVTVAERYVDGAELAPTDIRAKDLTALKNVRNAGGRAIVAVRGNEAVMPIVCGEDGVWAAGQLQDTIFEMTGAKPAVIREKVGIPVTNAPAFYVGKTTAAVNAGVVAPSDHPEAFRVTAKGGSFYFVGKADHAVVDWCERGLGARYYWPEAVSTNKIYGKCVVKTDGLAVRPVDYDDRPVFGYRENWPYGGNIWNRWGKGGNSHRGGVSVHAPHGWWKETNALDHVEIFALSADGKRPTSPLLCYGNPKTVEYYEQRTEEGIRAYDAYLAAREKADPKEKGKIKFKDPSGGILNYAKKVVTISQWDCGVYCACEHCKKLYDPKLGSSGSGSPIIWGFFTKRYAQWLKVNHPDWKISILPYVNTCDVPPDPNDPSKPLSLREEGNVEAMLCTMPGLAMLKNAECKKHEEDLIRQWVKCTGNPVLNWHYSCWPAEFTSAPFVYGETIRKHYKDMEKDLVGTFINGGYDMPRLQLSGYVWMRCLWNPNVDVKAVYDGFAARMFGKAAGPMRELVAMQEAGWNRQWGSNMCSTKNIHQISYPRKEVLKMAALLDEAQRLARGDEKVLARLAWYRSGFAKFLKESEETASGTAFVPFNMKKAAQPPKIDGKLDDPCWTTAEGRALVAARDLKNPKPKYATEVKAVWYPGAEGGVTFSFRCEEPATAAMKEGVMGDPWGQDNTEIFLDVSGSGDGHFYQIVTDGTGRYFTPTDGIGWKPKGLKTGVHIGNGEWSMEVFVPFADLMGFPKVQLPTTSANGVTWTGNFNRWRVGDMKLPKEQRAEGSKNDWSRLFTRGNFWNKDPAAFGEFKFVE